MERHHNDLDASVRRDVPRASPGHADCPIRTPPGLSPAGKSLAPALPETGPRHGDILDQDGLQVRPAPGQRVAGRERRRVAEDLPAAAQGPDGGIFTEDGPHDRVARPQQHLGRVRAHLLREDRQLGGVRGRAAVRPARPCLVEEERLDEPSPRGLAGRRDERHAVAVLAQPGLSMIRRSPKPGKLSPQTRRGPPATTWAVSSSPAGTGSSGQGRSQVHMAARLPPLARGLPAPAPAPTSPSPAWRRRRGRRKDTPGARRRRRSARGFLAAGGRAA